MVLDMENVLAYIKKDFTFATCIKKEKGKYCHVSFHMLSLNELFVEQDWFEQYRERVIEAEQMILTALNFELSVQHPYVPLTSILNKLGLSQTVLVNLALNLVSEG